MSALWLFLLGTILVTGGFVAVTELGGGGAPMQRAPDFSVVLDEVAEIAERIDEQVSGRTGDAARNLGDFLADLPQQLGVEHDEDESISAEDPSLPTDEAASTDAPDPVSESPGPPPSMFGFDRVDSPVDDSTNEDPGERLSDPAETEDDRGGKQNSGRRVDVCQSGGTNTVTVGTGMAARPWWLRVAKRVSARAEPQSRSPESNLVVKARPAAPMRTRERDGMRGGIEVLSQSTRSTKTGL